MGRVVWIHEEAAQVDPHTQRFFSEDSIEGVSDALRGTRMPPDQSRVRHWGLGGVREDAIRRPPEWLWENGSYDPQPPSRAIAEGCSPLALEARV